MPRSGSSFPFLALLMALWVVGCGYRPLRYQDASGERPRVAIETLENDTFDAGVDLIFTGAIRREFLSRGGLRLVTDPKKADLVVKGVIDSIRTRSKSVSSVVLALEYTMTVTLDLRFERRDGIDIDLDRNTFRDSEIYLASADVEAGRKNREEALRRVAGLLATRVRDAVDRELVQ